jgi:asparagine synthase (glutamine-hydrolysing)
MSHGLEVRVPLLDHKLAELSFSILPALQYGNGERKHLLKRALKGDLPTEVLTARKKGFSVPIDNWMTQGLAGESAETLRDGVLVQRGVFDPSGLSQFLAAGARGKYLWLLLSAELWARTWLN